MTNQHIDLTTETPIPINQAPKYYPAGRPNISTVYRHFTRGCRGAKLETFVEGGRRYTTVEAIRRHYEVVTHFQKGFTMKLNDLFPSRYLKAADLQGREVSCVISHVATELMEGQQGKEQKGVVYFRGKDKGLVLNQVNANAVAEAYGVETDDWGGCTIVLYPTRTQFGSKMVDCVRIRVPVRAAAAPTPMEEGDAADNTPF